MLCTWTSSVDHLKKLGWNSLGGCQSPICWKISRPRLLIDTGRDWWKSQREVKAFFSPSDGVYSTCSTLCRVEPSFELELFSLLCQLATSEEHFFPRNFSLGWRYSSIRWKTCRPSVLIYTGRHWSKRRRKVTAFFILSDNVLSSSSTFCRVEHSLELQLYPLLCTSVTSVENLFQEPI